MEKQLSISLDLKKLADEFDAEISAAAAPKAVKK